MQILEKDGWKVLCKSSDFPDTKGNDFKAVAFVNDKTKEVLISTVGTVPTDKHDLKDDVYIAAGTYPSKVTEVITMINHVSTLLGTDSNKYIYNFTGHSLGASLSERWKL
ncbi:MAG: hypothetical protein LN588_02155 [Rickettsia endosymbiont of Bryobia graminum]|nr:hypothetical protein [Rickettsia endosymbiont of Bryobia graminum]